MSAIILQQAGQRERQHLYEQLVADGMLQIGSWNEAEEYLISKGIYDVTLIKEKDFREYKRVLMQRKGYTKQRAIQRSADLRKIQKYWIEKEFGELLEEIREYDVPEPKFKGNIQNFLIRQKIHHIREVDYLMRERYEEELRKTRNYSITLRYLNVFDHLKQLDIQKEMGNFASRARNRIKFKNQIIFLPYLPDQELAKEFDYTQDKNELVWDFTKVAPEQLKRQVFELLNYILENLYRDDPKERRIRYLLPLRWLYDFCTAEAIPDLECMEQCHIQKFERIVEKKVVNVKNAMQIVDNCRKILFVTAKDIHWHANVWYMERFHLSESRLNPSNPVMRLTFIDVKNKRNRKLLQEYAQYHIGIGGLTIANIRQQLYEIKRLLQFFDAEEFICSVDSKLLDGYFKRLDEVETKEDTFNKRIVHIYKFYVFLKINGYIKEIPFELGYYWKKTFPVHHDRTVEEQVYNEILYNLNHFHLEARFIFLHLWCTGLRISEVCTLKGDAYTWDGEDAWLKIYQIKMKAEKMIPIPFILYVMMQSYIRKKNIRPGEYIFKSQDGGAYRVGTFVKYFKEKCQSLGIENSEYAFRTHDYRHTLATQLFEDHVSLQTIRDYLGHYSEEMTKQYVDYMPKKVIEANKELYNKPENSMATMIKVKKRGEKHGKKNLPE